MLEDWRSLAAKPFSRVSLTYFTKRWKTVLIAALFIATAYFIWRLFIVPDRKLPPDFLEIKGQAALIAVDIVSLAGESNSQLKEIGDLDRRRAFSEALKLVSAELERNKEMRGKAISLSGEIEKMARLLPGIQPTSARTIALQALNYEVALISRLIAYNGYLNDLLEVLQDKFSGNATGPVRNGGSNGAGSNGRVNELISKINQESYAINELNGKFNSTMEIFETWMGK